MRRIVLSTSLAALMTVTLAGAPALAQTDVRALYDRIDRLERDISVLQQGSARGGGPTVIRSPALGGGVERGGAERGGESSLSPGMASRLDDRVEQLEDQLRQITGKVEEANFKNGQLAKQLERMQAEMELRFKELQPAAGQPGAGQPQQGMAAPAAPVAANGAPVLTPPKSGANLGGNSAEGTGPAPGPQTLGTLSEKDLKKPAAAQPAAAAAPAAPKDPQGAYEEAYNLAQRGDYAGAEKGFKGFLQQYPSHQLAGNASFWLGEIAYTGKDYANAASLYAEAYKKYPKHTKAPDMLYKLSASFAQLKKNDEACRALGYLFREHPDMPDRIKRAATADKQKLACPSR